MNKTRKNKYLRKNRGNEDSKHKTRKVQRGGFKVFKRNAAASGTGTAPSGKPSWFSRNKPATGTAALPTNRVLSGNTQPLGRTREEIERDREARIKAQNKQHEDDMEQYRREKIEHEAAAAASTQPPTAAEATPAPPAVTSQARPLGNFKSTNMGFGFGGPIQPSAEAAATLSSSPAPPAAANKTPTAPAKAETNEERDAQLAEVALEISKGKQKSNPQAVALANSPSNIIKSFFLNLFESKKKELPTALAIDNLTKNISTIIDENDKNLDIVNTVGDAIRKHIRDIIDNNKNLSDLTDDDRHILIVLIGDLARVGEIAQKIANNSSELAYAGTTDGNLDALKQSRYNQGFGGQKFGQKFNGPRNAGVAKTPTNKVPTPSSGKKQDSPSESAKPKSRLQKFTNFFTKKNKKQEPAAATAEATPAAAAATAEATPAAATPAPKTEPPATPAAAATAEATPAPKTEPPAPEPTKPQAAGGKTRKTRHFIHEIKDNRTHLFNKEMEIINSIRNFKHGRIDNDNTKKQFMKSVKRG
jgi:hypothetical protein